MISFSASTQRGLAAHPGLYHGICLALVERRTQVTSQLAKRPETG
jgi:hypothetical protein